MYTKYKNKKVVKWISRYLPGEIIGTLTALIGATITYNVTHSYIAAGIAGTICENIGYYGYFISLEAYAQYKKHKEHPLMRRTALITSNTAKRLLVEFGLAEAVDSLLVRPYLMTVTPQYIGPYWLGTLIGKIAADSIFYSFAIMGHEYEAVRKKSKNAVRQIKDRLNTPS